METDTVQDRECVWWMKDLRLQDVPWEERRMMWVCAPMCWMHVQRRAGFYCFCVQCRRQKCKELFPEKTVWSYTGFLWEDVKDEADLKYFDVLAEGRFVEELLDNNLHWVGSTNQRVINVPESLKTGEIVLHESK
jgi:hypothetical protein